MGNNLVFIYWYLKMFNDSYKLEESEGGLEEIVTGRKNHS